MSDQSKDNNIKRVSYICGECKAHRNLTLDADVHLKRRELSINGLASYIDIHSGTDGKRHGCKLFIDPNFHVRTNNALKIKENKPTKSAIPLPGLKTKNLTTKFNWDSWSSLELELNAENIKFILKIDDKDIENKSKELKMSTTSELGSVICELNPLLVDPSPDVLENIEGWMRSLCNAIELASSLHVDLIPEILRYIDHHSHRAITYNDKIIIGILVDKAAILIPDKETMEMVAKYGPALKLIGLEPVSLSKIANKLCKQDRFSMIDIQKILESELKHGDELEEEVIVLALFYLLSLDAFDYKLSYLQVEENND